MRTALFTFVLVLGMPLAALAQDDEDDLLALLEEHLRRVDLPKYALVMGVENYEHLPRVTNAMNDARAVGTALEGLGFNVDQATDLGRQAFFDRLGEFVNRSLGHSEPETAIVLFYFAGHGFALGQGNFLVPADASEDSDQLPHHSIPLSYIVDKITGSNVALSLIFVDACRTELSSVTLDRERVSFAESPPIGPQSVYYGFASSLGRPSLSYARPSDANSPFSNALATHLSGARNKKLRDVFESVRWDVTQATEERQIPREQKDFLGEYRVRPSDGYAETLEGKLARALIKGPACVREYVATYPAGPFTTGARSWLLRRDQSALNGATRCPR